MTMQNFLIKMAGVNKNFSNNIFNPKDNEQIKLWYEMLKDIEDDVFEKAIIKLMCNEKFAPNIHIIRTYCAEVAAPIQVDDTEGWGLVMQSVRNYGYMRAEEALQSLPQPVKEAVMRIGGFRMICESDEPDVIRGQFNRAMAAINTRDRSERKTAIGLKQAIFQINNNNTSENEIKYIETNWQRSSEDVVKSGIESVEEVMRNMGLRGGKDEI